MLGIIWNISEGLIVVLLTFYFRFISKSWRPPIVLATLLAFISGVYVYLKVPESPKWLYSQQRYLECLKALNYMAGKNGVRLSTDSILNKSYDSLITGEI